MLARADARPTYEPLRGKGSTTCTPAGGSSRRVAHGKVNPWVLASKAAARRRCMPFAPSWSRSGLGTPPAGLTQSCRPPMARRTRGPATARSASATSIPALSRTLATIPLTSLATRRHVRGVEMCNVPPSHHQCRRLRRKAGNPLQHT